MGMFDTIHIECPWCGELTPIQTKSGVCQLKKYHQDRVPIGAASALEDYPEDYTCDKCEKPYGVEVWPKRVKVRAHRIVKVSTEDDDEGDWD